jgi:uncharacterized protein
MGVTSTQPVRLAVHRRLLDWLPLGVTGLLVAAALLGWAGDVWGRLPVFLALGLDRLSNFSGIFLAIFFEAAPFLLLGTLGSGFVEEFVSQEDLARWMPRSPLLGALVGAFLGLFVPVCECGVVPFTRRLLGKGLPLSSAVTILLAAPVVNPIVIASTLAAFGLGPIFWGRLGFSFVIAVAVGVIFSRFQAEVILRPDVILPHRLRVELHPSAVDAQLVASKPVERIRRMLVIAADEFFEIGRYLVLGASLAALMQTFIPQSALLAIGQGPVLSVLMLLVVAVLLSICSTVDAFIALAFVNTFSQGAVLAFLVFGPMVDIKSSLLYLRLFKRKPTGLLILLPFLFSLGIGVLVNWMLR